MIRSNPHIAQMAPYALAEITPPANKRLVSLSQNESLRPPSPHVAQVLMHAAANAHLYPDRDWHQLRCEIARVHNLQAQNILCGNGSLDLIGALARAYLDASSAALAPKHSYPFFRSATNMSGARIDLAEEQGLTADVDILLASVRPDTKIVFVANPGNPTGTRLPCTELTRLRASLRDDIILVVDEAYGEFADQLGEPMFDLVDRGDTVIFRTFSKAYGLAGMRVGWGYAPQAILGEMRKVMNPNNVALPSQLAASAAMQDQAYMRETCAITEELRTGFSERMRSLGLGVPDSFTNFVLMKFPSPAVAERVDAALRAEGVFLRPQGGAGLTDCLRATVGVADDMDLAASLIETAMQREESV